MKNRRLAAPSPALDAQRYLAAILESSPDAMTCASLDGTISTWNAAAERLFGFTADELVGKSVWTVIPERRDVREAPIVERLKRKEPLEPFETTCRRKDGSEFGALLTLAPVTDEAGRIVGVSVIAHDLTEVERIRREVIHARDAEEAANKESLFLAAIVESSSDAILSRSVEGKVASWNGAAERLFGFTAQEMIGQSLWDLVPDRIRDETALIFEDVDRGERIEPFETIRKCKDGSEVAVSVTLSPIKDKSGKHIGSSTIARDITDAKRIRRELLEAKEAAEAAGKETSLLAAIVESSGDAISSSSLDGLIASWNVAAEGLFGFLASEMIGQSLWTLVPESRRTEETRIFERLMAGERIEPFETVRKRKDGSEVEVSVTLSPIRDRSGASIGISTIARDITEVKGIQRELVHAKDSGERANKEKLFLAAIVESSSDAIVSRNPDGSIASWNGAAERLFGYTAEEMLGGSMWVLVPDRIRSETAEVLARLNDGERVEPFETVRRRKDGSEVEVVVTLSPIVDESGQSIGRSTIARDITEMKRIQRELVRARDAAAAATRETETAEAANERLEHEVAERKSAESKLRHAAYHDALTGLPNRVFFLERLRNAIKRMTRHSERLVAVLFLDLDRFKIVNDSLGHMAGDRLLAALARRLASCLRPYDMLARLGGDEFTILLEDTRGVRDACVVAERILHALEWPFKIDGHEVVATTSIGIVLGEPGCEDAQAMLRDADTAMYRAKQLGGGRYEVFVHELHLQAMARLQLEMDLRRALERGEFRLVYQPIVSLETGRVTGFEALARWQHPERGVVPPSEFIPVAEETGLIVPLGEWVLSEACRQARTWRDLLPGGPRATVSVNVSAKQLSAEALAANRFGLHVERVLAENRLDAAYLSLEITESVLLDHAGATRAALQYIGSLGVTMQLDDFGTGYSSLSYLERLPIQTVKIDRSFISGGLAAGIANPKIVAAIVALAKNLGKSVTAEGVETVEQLDELRALHCTNAQGYYLSRPLDDEGARAFLLR